MAQTAPQFDWESARPVDEEPQQPAATPSATDSSYPGAPLNDKQEASPLSPVLFDWESARPVESAQDFDLESAVPLKELAEDPAYLMSREQFRAYRNESKETDSAVAEFLGGISGVIPGLASMASGTIGELGQQVAQNWYRPDKLMASLTANQNEGVRRMSLSYAKMVDYIGQNLRDMDINRQREAAYGDQLRQKMQQEGKLTGDPIKDHDMVMQALFAAKDAGEIPLTEQQMAEDEERAYQDYWRGKNFDQAIGNITNIKIAGMDATTPSMEWGARNMVTGEYVAPGKSSPDVVSMAIDPANILAAGVGSLARVNALRRAGILLGNGLGPTGEVLAKAGAAVGRGADAVTERIQLATGGQRVGEKVIGGLSPEMQAYGGVTSAAAVGYMTGGDTPLDQAMTGALALLPAVRMVGGTLRKAGTAANAGWIITREMDAGAMSAARAEATKGLAANAAIPERYAKFIRGEGRASADSTLRRVAQDQANPRLLRSLSQFGDNIGLTSAVRATDDAIGGALVGASATAPFALAAPEPEQAGGIVGMGLMFGAVGGVAGGKMTRMAEMQDATVARMLVDTQASGGNAEAFARLPHQDLVSMAGLQAFSRGKLTFKPLTTSEYRVNLDVTKRRGENSAGFYVDTADDGTSTVFINMGEPSAVAGVVAKIRPVTKGGKTIEVRDKDGNSTFTYVPNESRIAVKQGDSVGVGTPLTRGTPSRLSVPEEIAHAIFSSKAMDGLPRDEMRNYINQRYKTEGVAARGREYAARIVDQEIAAGVYGAADSIDDAARDRLVEQRFTEFSQASIEDGADPLDWARDEIIAASLRASVQGIDLARLRNQSNFSRLAEQVVASSAQALRVLGVDVDKMGRVLDPAGTFRDNPVFADPAMRRMVTKYMRDYDQWLASMEDAGRKDKRGVRVAPSGKVEDYANSQHTVLREIKDANGNGTGVFENDVVIRGTDGVVRPKKQSDIDRTEVSRAAQIKSLWDAGKTVPTASTEFGKRRVNGRDIVGGPTLPPQWDLFTQFPKWIREFARQLEAGRADGRTWIADYNAIGTGSSGRYRVTNLGNIEAILREVAFVGWQVTKKNHLLATVFDMNAFRAAAKRAIDNGELGEMGNNMDEVNATLLQYLDNHKNGRPGEYGIGQTKKNILNGLIGTGTAKQTAANPFYAELNPRGSVRTFRVDRLNDLRDTGRTGYNFMYEPINANMMPDAVRAPEDLTTDQILRELEDNQGYLGLSTLGMREGRPVKGGAQRTRELLRRNEELNAELRRRGGTQEESDVQRVLRQRGQAMPDVADAPPFYLKSSQAIDAKVQGKAATVDQIKAILTNPQNGIKAEELKWTGVMQEVERLAKENNGKVPKDALLRYLAEDGAVRLEEVKSSYKAEDQKISAEIDDILLIQMQRAPYSERSAYLKRAKELQDKLDEIKGKGFRERYGQYQLPGGENYREVVLAMPEFNKIDQRALTRDELFELGRLGQEMQERGNLPPARMERWRELNGIKRLYEDAVDQARVPTYRSTHFPDTPNYVAHMRLNDRVDAKGKQGLFIEELQSDRHQAGREHGYKEPFEQWIAFYDAGGTEVPIGYGRSEKQALESIDKNWEGLVKIQTRKRDGVEGVIPDAPFRTSWPLQLFKRALRDAVADGKEWIGWTTGETQAARYDLSKQVKAIDVIDHHSGQGRFIDVRGLNGESVLSMRYNDKGIAEDGKPISDYIGKELAEKVMQLPQGQRDGNSFLVKRFDGVDLKVGGEGMKGFYDTMVPKEVAKYVKQWGGQVEKVRIGKPKQGTGRMTRDEVAEARKDARQLIRGDISVEEFNDAHSTRFTDDDVPGNDPYQLSVGVQTILDAMREQRKQEAGGSFMAWRVNITPQMREGIKKAGQALFVGGTAAVVAEDQLEQ